MFVAPEHPTQFPGPPAFLLNKATKSKHVVDFILSTKCRKAEYFSCDIYAGNR